MTDFIRLSKEDAVKLDIMLEVIQQSNYKCYVEQFYRDDLVSHADENDKMLEIYRLFEIISKQGCANVTESKYRGKGIERNPNTQRFISEGGFKKLFQNELNNSEQEKLRGNLSMSKLKWDSKLSKWKVKTFWPVFLFGLTAFVLGIVNFVDNRKKAESIEELQKSNSYNREEISKLRIFVLEQRRIDSLVSKQN